MKILTLQKRLRIIIALLGLVVIGILGGVIYPNVRSILQLQQEVDQTEAFLESQYQKTRRMERTITDLDAVVSSTAAYTSLTIPQGQELQLIETFESLATTYNIEQTLSVNYSEQKDSAVQLPFYTFTFLNHGLFSSHIAYLDALSRLPYVVDIDSIDVQRRNNNGAADELAQTTLRFSLKIYAK